MFTYIFFTLVGMFVGWFFLPRPVWAENTMTWVIAKVPFLAPFLKKN